MEVRFYCITFGTYIILLYEKHMHVGHAPTSFQLCGLSPIMSNKGCNVLSRCLNKSQVFCNYTAYLSPRLSYSKIFFGWQYEEISHLHNSHCVFPLLKLEEKINDRPQSGAYVQQVTCRKGWCRCLSVHCQSFTVEPDWNAKLIPTKPCQTKKIIKNDGRPSRNRLVLPHIQELTLSLALKTILP